MASGAEERRGGSGAGPGRDRGRKEAGRAGVRDPAGLGLGGVKAGRPGPAQLGSAPPAESRDAGPRARVTSASAADGGGGGGDMASELDVRARLQRAGQEHLLRFCAELAPGPRAALLAQLEPLEPEALREHCRRAAAACARPPAPAPDLAARLRPLPPERVGSASGVAPQTRRLWEEEGRRDGGPGGGRPSLRKAASPTERGDRGGGTWSSVCLLREIDALTRTSSGLGFGAPERCHAGSRPFAALPGESALCWARLDGQLPSPRIDSRGPVRHLHTLPFTPAPAQLRPLPLGLEVRQSLLQGSLHKTPARQLGQAHLVFPLEDLGWE